ncbi:MAG: hypothetical protein ACRDBY_06805, partial [Cetobacterium sp.]
LNKLNIRFFLLNIIKYISIDFGIEIWDLSNINDLIQNKKNVYEMAEEFLKKLKTDDISAFIRDEIRLYYRFLNIIKSIENNTEIKEKSQRSEGESYIKFPEKIEKIINELLDLDITIVEEMLKTKLDSGEINVIELRTIFKEIKNNKNKKVSL